MINGQSLLMLQLSWYTILNCTEVKCQKKPEKNSAQNHSSNLGVQKISKHYAKIKLKLETILWKLQILWVRVFVSTKIDKSSWKPKLNTPKILTVPFFSLSALLKNFLAGIPIHIMICEWQTERKDF